MIAKFHIFQIPATPNAVKPSVKAAEEDDSSSEEESSDDDEPSKMEGVKKVICINMN